MSDSSSSISSLQPHLCATTTKPRLLLNGTQTGIWFGEQTSNSAALYSVAHYVRLDGFIDPAVMQHAIRLGLSETDTVHAQFSEIDGTLYQSWRSFVQTDEIDVPLHDVTDHADPMKVAELMMEDDLAHAPSADSGDILFSHQIFKISETQWMWYQRFHHLCVDGYSFMAITRRILDIYNALVTKQAIPLTPFEPFDDAIEEYQHYLASDSCLNDKAFWQQYMAGFELPVSLAATDVKTAGMVNMSVRKQAFHLSLSDITTQLKQHNSRIVATDLLVAGIYAYIHKITQQTQIVCGMPFMRRMGSAALCSVGPTVNVLPVQLHLEGDLSLLSVAERMVLELRRVRKHQRYDAEQLQRDHGVSATGQSLYNISINLKLFEHHLPIHAAKATNYVMAAGPVDDLEFSIIPMGDSVQVEILAHPDRYSAAELDHHANRIQAFLITALHDFLHPIHTLPLPTHPERLAIDSWSRGADVMVDQGIRFITDLLETRAAMQAEYLALHFNDLTLTNRELMKRIHQLSRFLRANDIGQGDIVALALPRSADAVIAIMAVLNCGAAYLPLDLAYPQERLQVMCRDAKPALILTYAAQKTLFSAEYAVGCLDDLAWQTAVVQQVDLPLTDVDRRLPAKRSDLACLIYTSGSTGKPKGVMVTHGGLINLVTSHQSSLYEKTAQRVAANNQRRVRALHTASFSFDASWEQLFWLLLGHELWLTNDDARRDARTLTELVHAHQIDTLDVPPSLLAQMLDSGLMDNSAHQPCQILIGSEAAPPALWQQLQQYPDLLVTNFYGPTEYTVDAVSAVIGGADTPVIGRPIANTQIYVLNCQLELVPIGVTGELYLAGDSLTTGYWQQAAMTATRFVANPFSVGERMYRTGDLVRWNENGQLVFIGRSDNQVKVRGFRIELGDVESAIAALPGIANAVVVAEPFADSYRLLAYCLLQQGYPHCDGAALLEQLTHQLPEYMVPAGLCILESWPMTVNGKIDKKALPPIEVVVRSQGSVAKTPEEAVVCQAIAKILNLTDVFADDDFFALGGDSISAMTLGNALRRAGFLLRAKDIFSLRQAEQMALALQPLKQVASPHHDAAFTLPALPMTRWFDRNFSPDQHFAHAVVVNVPAHVTSTHLVNGLIAIMRAHPVLRSAYQLGALHVPAMAEVISNQIPTQWVSETNVDYENAFNQAISRLTPAQGIMGQLVLCRGNPDQLSLMIVLHHLVVDGVSWRILLPEIEFAVMSAAAGTTPIVAPEEYALADWAASLNAQIARRRETEAAFWLQQLAEPLPQLGSRKLTDDDRYRHVTHARLLVPSALSQALLLSLPSVYRINIEEMLLTVVAKACAAVFATSQICFAMESHGRHAIHELQDLNRTVGWLTNEYPLLLAFEPHAVDPNRDVKTIKQAMRQIPDSGLGYSILRYLDENSADIRAAEAAHRPSVLFNYLGRFAQSKQDWTPQADTDRFADVFAVSVDGDACVLYPLEVNIFVDESSNTPQLAINWSFIEEIVSNEVIAALHQQVIAEIERLKMFAETSPLLAADTLVSSETIATINDQKVVHLSDQELSLLMKTYGAQEAVLPVLPLQEGLLFHAQLGDAASQYNSITRLDLNGKVDISRLRSALDAVLLRHPQLAAKFDLDIVGLPLQLIPLTAKSDDWRWPWPWQCLSLVGMNANEQEKALVEIEKTELYRPFAIATKNADLLINAILVERADSRFTLFLTAHHLVVDGWSTPILIQDLLMAYQLGAVQLPATRVSYPSIMRELAGRDRERCCQIWTEALQGAKPTCLFEEGNANAPVKEAAITLPIELANKLTTTAQKQGLTLNTLMQGAWAALLSVMTGRDDVMFGTPVSGRFSPIDGIEEHIGLFSNTIPVRMTLDPHQPLILQLRALQEKQIQLMEYDAIGLGDIQRLAGGETMFDTLLVVENYPDQSELFSQTFYNLQVTGVHNRGYTHYPITALVLPGEQIHVLFEYREQVGDIQLWIERFQLLLAHLADDVNDAWSSVSLLTASEQTFIAQVNETSVRLPAQTLNDALQAQVFKTPQAFALADVTEQLTYQEVNSRVTALASQLIIAGVQPGDVVAVALPRSVNLTLALLAILRAGAAYLPLDVSYPDDRLAYMVLDAKPRVIVTETALQDRVGRWGTALLLDQLDWQNTSNLALPVVKPEMGAYLLYTSGSTGKPKGVLVSHAAIVNRILWMQHQYPLVSDDVILQKTPCSFDVSVWEFFWSMMVGAQLMMAPPEAHRDPELLVDLIKNYRVTTLHFVPSMLAAFVSSLEQTNSASSCHTLRRVFCSGEALSRELADHYASQIEAPLHNLYGPTEAAVDVTYKAANERDNGTALAASVPIGKPVWNTQLRILDALLRPVPVGVAGELYLCGVQLADGYLGKAAMTATRFVADPYDDGKRMYRTGDVVRWLPSGDVEYLGRSDDQLKIRGQRIELGEIESAMLALPGVMQAAVHARVLGGATSQAGMDNRQLVGYLVTESGVDTNNLRSLLAEKLPAHMVPVALVVVDRFPLSANGKLDRKSLPDPDTITTAQGRQPAPGMESEIAALFVRLLNVTHLQAEDDFFALGGHSLLAMRLAAELRKRYNKPIAVSQIMVAPTVAKLAVLLRDDASLEAARQASFSPVLRLREGEGKPLICIHPASGFAWQYSALLRYLPASLPVIGLQSPRPNGAIAMGADMDAVCDQHLAQLRQVQPTGPYRLLGYSLGGTIAQAIAARLQQAGDVVAFLGLLDTYPPEGQDWSGPTDEEAQDEVRREQAQFMVVAEETADDYAEQEKQAMFTHIVANYQDAVRLLSQGKTPRFDGTAELFVASKTLPADMNIQQTWAPYIRSLREHHFDCSHEDILSPESLETLGPLLVERMFKS